MFESKVLTLIEFENHVEWQFKNQWPVAEKQALYIQDTPICYISYVTYDMYGTSLTNK